MEEDLTCGYPGFLDCMDGIFRSHAGVALVKEKFT